MARAQVGDGEVRLAGTGGGARQQQGGEGQEDHQEPATSCRPDLGNGWERFPQGLAGLERLPEEVSGEVSASEAVAV